MPETLTFLGLESSCDDTGAAIVRRTGAGTGEILSNIVVSQTDLHAEFGGVVPEIAARAHATQLDQCVEQALSQAEITLQDLDGIAVTSGPGLIGGVMSGVLFAKGLGAGTNLPVHGVNHLAGHALTPRLTDGIEFPYLLLLVSGGHCQFIIVKAADQFHRLGGTIDDAPGEAFDKAARSLGLGQPGGPEIEKLAKEGDPKRFPFPRPLLDREGCDMSFSGLKTALIRERNQQLKENELTKQNAADLAASFQQAVCDVIVEKSRRAILSLRTEFPGARAFAVAGGVAANQHIRAGLETLCTASDIRFLSPPLSLCTDNAAMIAWAGIEQAGANEPSELNLIARPRWPLDSKSPAMLGSGKKGARA